MIYNQSVVPLFDLPRNQVGHECLVLQLVKISSKLTQENMSSSFAKIWQIPQERPSQIRKMLR